MTTRLAAALSSALLVTASLSAALHAQQPQKPQTQQGQTETKQPPQHRNLWIARFTCDPKAALSVAATQRHDSDILRYAGLFDTVITFETDATQPSGSWSLTASEVEFDGGSAATRALVGLGAGRAYISMEYKLSDPSGHVVWTEEIKTRASFWTGIGAAQNQGEVGDEQAKKLAAALTKYFGTNQPNKN